MEQIVNAHIEKLPEGVYLATSEDFRGLVAQGRTVTETLEIAREAAKKLLQTQQVAYKNYPTAPGRVTGLRTSRAGCHKPAHAAVSGEAGSGKDYPGTQGWRDAPKPCGRQAAVGSGLVRIASPRRCVNMP